MSALILTRIWGFLRTLGPKPQSPKPITLMIEKKLYFFHCWMFHLGASAPIKTLIEDKSALKKSVIDLVIVAATLKHTQNPLCLNILLVIGYPSAFI